MNIIIFFFYRVDGALFVNLNEPEFAELGITNRLHLRKLELGMKGYRFRSLRRKEKKYKKLNEDDVSQFLLQFTLMYF